MKPQGYVRTAALLLLTATAAPHAQTAAPPKPTATQEVAKPAPQLPAAATTAAPDAKAPELTEKERDTLIIKLQAKALADQAVTIAQVNAKAATDDAIAFVTALQKDGYDFNYQTGLYTKKVIK